MHYFVALYSSEVTKEIVKRLRSSAIWRNAQRCPTQMRIASDGKRYRVMRVPRILLKNLQKDLKETKRRLTYLPFRLDSKTKLLEVDLEFFPPIGDSKRLRHALKQARERPALQ